MTLLVALLASTALAQDAGLDALKARQAKLKESKEAIVEREKVRDARSAELVRLLEADIAAIAAQGVEFRTLTDDEATAQFPKLESVVGRGADGLVVRVGNSYTHELELVVQPVGGKLFKMTWSYYKDGSFKVGVNVSRGGPVFFKGADYLDPKAVSNNAKAIKDGLVKYLAASS